MQSRKAIRTEVKDFVIYSLYLLVIWGTYRILFNLSEEVGEVLVKPIVWLLPLAYLLAKENKGLSAIGFTKVNFFRSLYFTLGLGVGFAVEGILVHLIKYSSIDFSVSFGNTPFWSLIGVGLVTAVTEETAFRGYLFTRAVKIFDKTWKANLVTSIVWTGVYIPAALANWELSRIGLVLYLGLVFLYGVGSAYIFTKTKNIAAPILLHFLWSWPIFLFR